MSRFSDEYDEMTDGQGVRRGAGGAAAAGDDVTRFLTEMRALGEVPAPEPSAELAALLAGATPMTLYRRRALRVVLRTAVVAALMLSALVVAAANHSLPRPAQRVVSNVVNDLTPFHIDSDRSGPGVVPPMPSDKPTNRIRPTAPTRPAHPSSTAPAGEDDTSGSGGEGGGDDGSARPSRSRSEDDGSGSGPGSDDGVGGGDDRASSPRTSSSGTRRGDDGLGDGGGSGGGRDG